MDPDVIFNMYTIIKSLWISFKSVDNMWCEFLSITASAPRRVDPSRKRIQKIVSGGGGIQERIFGYFTMSGRLDKACKMPIQGRLRYIK